MLVEFAEYECDILRERVKAGIAQARENGKAQVRPATATKQAAEVKKFFKKGLSKSEIARCLQIGRHLLFESPITANEFECEKKSRPKAAVSRFNYSTKK